MPILATPAGNASEVWRRAIDAAPRVDPADIVPGGDGGALLVVGAHPDDETIGAGRLVSHWARHVGTVRALCLTRGEACLSHVGIDVPDLGQRRELEWHAALEHLHVDARRMGDLPDGHVRGAGELARELIESAAENAVAIAAPWRADPHPDHMATGRAAAWVAHELGIPLLEYPVWLTYWGDPSVFAGTGARLHRLVTDERSDDDRAAAIACYASQLEPLDAAVTALIPTALLADHHADQLVIRMPSVGHGRPAPVGPADLASLRPAPGPFDLPFGYPRHEPDVRTTATAMRHLAGVLPWAELDWPHLLEALVALGRTDIPLARLVEGHVDALRILAEAGREPTPDALYGVWASRSHGTGIRATPGNGGWDLEGTLRFASGAGVIDRALVPVWTGEDTHLLLDLPVARWDVDASQWATSAMAVSRSHTIRLTGTPAPEDAAVGGENWYLRRPGFFPGGVGVAAVWAGGAARLVDLVRRAVEGAPPQASRTVRLGRVRTELATALALVGTAGERLEEFADARRAGAGRDLDADVRDASTEVRAGVAAAVLRLVEEARRIAGPAGLAHDRELLTALADLDLYVRQQNPDSDAAHLGR